MSCGEDSDKEGSGTSSLNYPDHGLKTSCVKGGTHPKQPVPAMERFPLDYDDEGIGAVEALLAPHTVIAMHHWQGHTDYTRHDLIQDMLRQGNISTGHPRRVFQEKPSVDAPLPTQLCALMRSEAYEDWRHAWALLLDHTTDAISTY